MWGGRGLLMSVTVVVTLLLVIIDVKASGEYCHGWHDTQGTWREGFQCPEKFDGEDAIICCGKCELRYCCSSTEARLDQGTCENDKQAQEPGTNSKENKDTGAGGSNRDRSRLTVERLGPTAGRDCRRSRECQSAGHDHVAKTRRGLYYRLRPAERRRSSASRYQTREHYELRNRGCRHSRHSPACRPRDSPVPHLRSLPDRGPLYSWPSSLVGSVVCCCCCRLSPAPKQNCRQGVGGRQVGSRGAERPSPGDHSHDAQRGHVLAVHLRRNHQAPSTVGSSSSAPPAQVPRPAPQPMMRTQASCCLPTDASVFVNMPTNFSVLNCQQATQIMPHQGQFIHPQYIGYATHHMSPPQGVYLDPTQGGYRQLQSPYPPPTSVASVTSEQKYPPVTV
nr:protein shisa-2-like [Salvelinus alpinus]